ncbi:MAG: MFS transporter [Gammaproteobacteria bacterium]|nr:MFS transporter [Gammaproteobacteria bacterium]
MVRVGIDWGSSAFRAYQFNHQGKVIESISADLGIKFIQNGNFAETLFSQIGTWLTPGDQVLLSGMITSRNGWVETPYVPCPADLQQVLNTAVRKEVNDIELIFLPGLCQPDPSDVMRGEEIQLFGAESIQPIQLAVMPGTHSKWTTINDGCIQGFHTIATGEIFEILLEHSLIGNLYVGNGWIETAFIRGVDKGFQCKNIIRELFTCRAAVLLGQHSRTDIFSYLSGLLIGNEIREGMDLTNWNLQESSSAIVTLIGSASLCPRYLTALKQLGIKAVVGPEDAVVPGFQQIISLLNGSK